MNCARHGIRGPGHLRTWGAGGAMLWCHKGVTYDIWGDRRLRGSLVLMISEETEVFMGPWEPCWGVFSLTISEETGFSWVSSPYDVWGDGGLQESLVLMISEERGGSSWVSGLYDIWGNGGLHGSLVFTISEEMGVFMGLWSLWCLRRWGSLVLLISEETRGPCWQVFFQFLSRVWLFVTWWITAHQASLSITSSRSLLKLRSIEWVMPSNHLILCSQGSSNKLNPSFVHNTFVKNNHFFVWS